MLDQEETVDLPDGLKDRFRLITDHTEPYRKFHVSFRLNPKDFRKFRTKELAMNFMESEVQTLSPKNSEIRTGFFLHTYLFMWQQGRASTARLSIRDWKRSQAMLPHLQN